MNIVIIKHNVVVVCIKLG